MPGSAEGCAAFPYESVYTSPKRLVMQDAWERVKSLYAAHGVRIDTDSSELMEDHIAYELAYMALLCREGAERAEQRAFLEEHLLTWVPDFCADLQRCAGTGFYRCVAQLTLGWLKLEEGGGERSVPVQLPRQHPGAGPDPGGAGERVPHLRPQTLSRPGRQGGERFGALRPHPLGG